MLACASHALRSEASAASRRRCSAAGGFLLCCFFLLSASPGLSSLGSAAVAEPSLCSRCRRDCGLDSIPCSGRERERERALTCGTYSSPRKPQNVGGPHGPGSLTSSSNPKEEESFDCVEEEGEGESARFHYIIQAGISNRDQSPSPVQSEHSSALLCDLLSLEPMHHVHSGTF